jgi:hypothetical protein
MSNGIQLPMRAESLRERSRRDEREEHAMAREESPSDKLSLSLELSDLVRDLAESASAGWTRSATLLEEKARLYVLPLRVAASALR